METTTPFSSSGKLPSLKSLITESFQFYLSSWRLLIWLIILPILATALIVILVGVIMVTILSVTGGELVTGRIPYLIPPALVALIGLIIVSSLGKIALIKAIDLQGQINTKELIRLSWPLVGKYILLQILLGLTIIGGFILLVIPGIIFSVWFSFTPFILIAEGIGGRAAFRQSKAYVKGKFWGILGRMVFLIVVMALATGISSAIDQQIVTIVVQLISTLVLAPLATIYTFKLYQGAKSSTLMVA